LLSDEDCRGKFERKTMGKVSVMLENVGCGGAAAPAFAAPVAAEGDGVVGEGTSAWPGSVLILG